MSRKSTYGTRKDARREDHAGQMMVLRLYPELAKPVTDWRMILQQCKVLIAWPKVYVPQCRGSGSSGTVYHVKDTSSKSHATLLHAVPRSIPCYRMKLQQMKNLFKALSWKAHTMSDDIVYNRVSSYIIHPH